MLSYNDEFEGLAQYIPDPEDREILLKFRRGITPYGFEVFITKYFESIEGYVTNTTEEYDKDCVDVEGKKDNSDLLVQCKRWMTYTRDGNIRIHHVREFFGAIQKRKTDRTRLVYVTTTWANKNAKDFCIENDIELWDYKKIIEILKVFPFNDFLNYALYNPEGYPYQEIFEKNIVEHIEELRGIKKKEIIQETKSELQKEKNKVTINEWKQERKRINAPHRIQEKRSRFSIKNIIVTGVFIYMIITIIGIFGYSISQIWGDTIKNTIQGIKTNVTEYPVMVTPNKKRNIQTKTHYIP